MMLRYPVILLILFGCNCGCPDPQPLVSDYFPLRKGIFHIYAIDSVVISQNVETAYSYELKTEVTDSFPNSEGGFTYVIARYKRITSTSPWTTLNSWSARADPFQATVNEGNISYVRIAKPIYNGNLWDGNALNAKGGTEKCLKSDSHTCDLYEIRDSNMPFTASADMTFDITFTVVESDNGDLIVSQDKRFEVYALGTGLVSREITKLEYCTDVSCLGSQFIDKGVKYKQRITGYGGM